MGILRGFPCEETGGGDEVWRVWGTGGGDGVWGVWEPVYNIWSQYCPHNIHTIMNCLSHSWPSWWRLHTEKFRRSVVRDKKELQWDSVHIWRTWHGEEWAGIFLRRSLTWNISTTYILHPVRPSAKYECNFIWNMTQTTESKIELSVPHLSCLGVSPHHSASCVLSQVWALSYLNMLTQKRAGF